MPSACVTSADQKHMEGSDAGMAGLSGRQTCRRSGWQQEICRELWLTSQHELEHPERQLCGEQGAHQPAL